MRSSRYCQEGRGGREGGREGGDYSPWFILGVQKTFGGKDSIGKSISKGAEWYKIQRHSTFE